MKIVYKKKELMRLAAANTLRLKGFEVYVLPDNGIGCIPHLVAYRSGRFYNVYLYESAEEKNRIFSEQYKSIFKYASALNAVVLTASIRIVPAE